MNGLFVNETNQGISAIACVRLLGQECFFWTAGGEGQRVPLPQRDLEDSGSHISRRSTKD